MKYFIVDPYFSQKLLGDGYPDSFVRHGAEGKGKVKTYENLESAKRALSRLNREVDDGEALFYLVQSPKKGTYRLVR